MILEESHHPFVGVLVALFFLDVLTLYNTIHKESLHQFVGVLVDLFFLDFKARAWRGG